MSKFLIVVDMQNDFISGSLGTDEAKAIVPNVKKKIESSIGNREIIFTMDTHYEDYLETSEGRKLPVAHCIYESDGWQLDSSLSSPLRSKGLSPDIIIKNTFGSSELVELLKFKNESEAIEEIELVGLCTDICVISNALIIKAFFPEIKIVVDSACCAGVTPASHQNALEAMKMCHIDVV